MTDSQADIYRILDAAGNRTREGLRVIEDYVRFGLNDAHLSRILKEHRHELASILSSLPASSLLTSRDTLHDVGTTISTPSENLRTSARHVAVAAFKRVQEALRTLEEYTKVVDSELAPRLERLRYELYTSEKVVFRTEAADRRLESRELYLLVTAADCQNGFEATVKGALDSGVRIIQSREKLLTDREWLHCARALRDWTSAAEALLIINDRPDIAILSDADGVQLGQEEITVQDARKILGPDRLIGISTHSIDQARRAVVEGADYLGVGPTFPSMTKPFLEFPGIGLIRDVAAEIRLPWFAIGGINVKNVAEVAKAGATRIAVSGAICRSTRPECAAQELIAELKVADGDTTTKAE